MRRRKRSQERKREQFCSCVVKVAAAADDVGGAAETGMNAQGWGRDGNAGQSEDSVGVGGGRREGREQIVGGELGCWPPPVCSTLAAPPLPT